MNTLFLRLEGPLQSWGVRSQWGERDTSDAPSKSGVIGLLGCAMGLRRDDDSLRVLSEMLRFGVRIDCPGRLLVDYHTTGGGTFGNVRHDGGTRYTDQPYAGGVPSAEIKNGRIKVKITGTIGKPETDVSTRYYLADASFLAALQGNIDVEQLAEALQNPVWPYFLGRKACIPTQPIFAGTGDFADLASALQGQLTAERAIWPLRALIEATFGQGTRQNDHIVATGRRVFGPRYVQEIHLNNPLASATQTTLNTLEG
jgi:CRISPR system Cascade subunit CasD